MEAKLRPSQVDILKYRQGWMGISAVPGSGKTYTLSALAAEIIKSGVLDSDQEVLVVTLVNSAVDNFSRRVGSFLKEETILPGLGYRVRTLHGLAHDIIRERPALAGLASDFSIVDEHAASEILSKSIQAWIRMHTPELHLLVDTSKTSYKFEDICRRYLPDTLEKTALAFIRTAKDKQYTPEDLRERLKISPARLPLVEMCLDIYTDYQRALMYRNALDFDDLMRTALMMLKIDNQLLERLRHRWPYILEDEAQDSSRLQEDILRLMAGENGNWVRVGDPNQAIYETFTTANPKYLRDFVKNEKVIAHDLPASGRSTKSIIALANYLIEWTMNQHPNQDVRSALAPPAIQPVETDDPAPNPPEPQTGSGIQIKNIVLTPEAELDKVATHLENWLRTNGDKTVAVLGYFNAHMENMAEVLQSRHIPYVEILRSSSSSRHTASKLTTIIQLLADPLKIPNWKEAFKVWCLIRSGEENLDETQKLAQHKLERQSSLADFIYPVGVDPLDKWEAEGISVPAINLVYEFRQQARIWLDASILPIDQLMLTLAQELFNDPADLALAHKLAAYLNQMSRLHADWRLPEYAAELSTFAGYARKLSGFSSEDEGFDPDKYKGKVVLSTLHKAKGLEWDKVYLTSINNYDFPSGAENDEYYSESWFMQNRMNLLAETLAELDQLQDPEHAHEPNRGEATIVDRNRLIAERLRLLFVGITRAKQELVISWNNGKRGSSHAAVTLLVLERYLSGYSDEPQV